MRHGRTKPDKADAVAALAWQLKHMAPWIPMPAGEYRFHPTRDWRFDLCWPAPLLKLAVEVDGGIWSRARSGHQGAGHIRDIRKGNDAILCGYRVLHFIPEDIVTDSGRPVEVALAIIRKMFVVLGYNEEEKT